jgi:O-antigen ligase/peptidoglycan/xylan/chitin deacetylase (PgdA/CDA1 family)
MAADVAGRGGQPSRVEQGAALLVLFLSTGALMPLLRGGGGAADTGVGGTASRLQVEGDPVQQLVWLAAHAVVAGLLLWHRRAAFHAARQSVLLWLLVGLALFSTVWSASPGLTFRRSLLLVGTTGFGVYLAARYSRAELAAMVSAVLGAAAVLSLVFALLIPDYGLEAGFHEGAWRGIYSQKNGLGTAMALGTIIWLLLAVYRLGPRAVVWPLLGLSAALVLLSDSKTSWVVLLGLAACLPLIRTIQTRRGPGIGLALVLGGVVVPPVVAWLSHGYERVLTALGRDATLTGRVEYWTMAWQAIERRPGLGYGYGAFWQGIEGPSADLVVAIGENPTHAHNGLLDLWLVLGLAGVLLVSCSLLVNLARAFARNVPGSGLGGAFPPIFLFFLLLSNLLESALVTYNSLLWVVYAAITIQLAPGAVVHRPAPVCPIAARRPASPTTGQRRHRAGRRAGYQAPKRSLPAAKAAGSPLPMAALDHQRSVDRSTGPSFGLGGLRRSNPQRQCGSPMRWAERMGSPVEPSRLRPVARRVSDRDRSTTEAIAAARGVSDRPSIGRARDGGRLGVRGVRGRLGAVAAAWRSRTPILCYHSVSGAMEARSDPWSVTQRSLERQIRLLQRLGYRSLTLRELVEAFEAGKPTGKAVVLTFDDAYRDTITIAAPILDRHRFRATVFVVTDLVGKTAPWTATDNDPAARLATWEEIRSLRDRGWEVGHHSATHPDLTTLGDERLATEVGRGLRTLEREMGSPVESIAYPWGRHSPAVLAAAAASGARAAVGATRTSIATVRSLRFAIPRCVVRRDDTLLDVFLIVTTGYRLKSGPRFLLRWAARALPRRDIPRPPDGVPGRCLAAVGTAPPGVPFARRAGPGHALPRENSVDVTDW